MIDVRDKIHVADPFCRDCESTNVRVEHVPSIEPAREGHWPEFSYLRPVIICNEPDCGEEFLAKEHKEALHNAICKANGLLTPAEIRETRVSFGKWMAGRSGVSKKKISQKEFARALGLGESTVARYESRASMQNKAIDNLLRASQLDEFRHILVSDHFPPTNVVPLFEKELGESLDETRQRQDKFRLRANSRQANG